MPDKDIIVTVNTCLQVLKDKYSVLAAHLIYIWIYIFFCSNISPLCLSIAYMFTDPN